MLTQIRDGSKRVWAFVERRDIYTVLIIVLVSFASFGLGKLSQDPIEKIPVQIENAFENMSANVSEGVVEGAVTSPVPAVTRGSFLGSKNSDKYHYPWCPGAQRIKEENKVWFVSREAAAAAGYVAAKNCKGL